MHGMQIAKLESGKGHWNSPIVVDGKTALPDGNANLHAIAGVPDTRCALGCGTHLDR